MADAGRSDDLRRGYRRALLQIAARDLTAADPRDVLPEIAAELADPGVRKRLLAATSALAGVVHSPGEPVRPVGPECSLSAREIDVLAQVALGLSNAEVATRLTLSPETIKAYLRNIAAKLGTRSRMESVMRARLLGVLP